MIILNNSCHRHLWFSLVLQYFINKWNIQYRQKVLSRLNERYFRFVSFHPELIQRPFVLNFQSFFPIKESFLGIVLNAFKKRHNRIVSCIVQNDIYNYKRPCIVSKRFETKEIRNYRFFCHHVLSETIFLRNIIESFRVLFKTIFIITSVHVIVSKRFETKEIRNYRFFCYHTLSQTLF